MAELKDKPRAGRPEYERAWTLRFNLHDPDDRELWAWLRSLNGTARQFLVKQALRAGRGQAAAPRPAAADGDAIGTFEV